MSFNMADDAMLQWGRDLTVADIWESQRKELYDEAASMGPRPNGRGYTDAGAWVSTVVELQWGRDLTVADISCSASTAIGMRALQWGRDLTVADMRTYGMRPSGTPRFNGAAT